MTSIERLVAHAKAGDDQAFRALITKHNPLLRGYTRLFYAPGSTSDDVYQEALIGLWKSVRDYQPASGIPFGAFADLCVRRQVITCVKTATRAKHAPLNTAFSLSQPATFEDQGALLLADVLVDDSAVDEATRIHDRERFQELVAFLAENLSELERHTLAGYFEQKTYAEIEIAWVALQRARGETIAYTPHEPGTTAKIVDNALQRVRVKARNFLEGREAA